MAILPVIPLLAALIACFPITPFSAVVPQESGGKYTLTAANVRLEVDPQAAGRISSLQVNGEEVLFVNQSYGDGNWGSIFWPSPQQPWAWPPPAVLNNQPFTGGISGDRIVLRSGSDPVTGLRITNIYSADESDTSITVTYVMKNETNTTKRQAPWEITRIPSGGLIFFPSGQSAPTGILTSHTRETGGIQWFDYDALPIPGGTPKLLSDGSEGWQAHARASGIFLMKQWTDVPIDSQAIDLQESEIEIYMSPDKPYYEMEQQGFYRNIAPGDSLVWPVKWICRKVPAGITVEAGNAGLLAWAQSLAKQTVTVKNKSAAISRTAEPVFISGSRIFIRRFEKAGRPSQKLGLFDIKGCEKPDKLKY